MDDKREVVCYIILTHYGTYYTGISNSIIRRWKEHKAHESSYLSRFEAKEVVYIAWFDNRREAARKERFIKSIGAKKFLIKLRYKSVSNFDINNFCKFIKHGSQHTGSS